MTDRPDPFDDLEFETAPSDEAETVVAEAAAAKPTAAAAKADANARPVEAEAAEAPPRAAAANLVGYATMAFSGLAFAGTIAAVVVTLASRPVEPKVSPEHAAIGRIEALLTLQQGRLSRMATAATAQPVTAPQVDPAQLAALGAAVHANQEALDKLPGLIARMPRGAVPAAPARPVIVTRTVAAPGGANTQVADVLRAQAAIQRQLDALAARMSKTTAACVAQSDGTIRYP